MTSHRSCPEADHAATVIHFAGSQVSLDGGAVRVVRDQLVAVAGEPSRSPVLLDFGNVRYVSGVALGTLIGLHKKMVAAGRRLIIQNVCPEVHEVFAITRLDQFLHIQGPMPTPPACATAAVLVAEDNDDVRLFLEMALRERGFEVWAVADGQEVVELYRRHPGAVVLLDVRMPGLDGVQTLVALQEVCPTVCCCFMTGDPSDGTQDPLQHLGAVRVFRKPFTLAEVAETLEQLAVGSSQGWKDRWVELPAQRAETWPAIDGGGSCPLPCTEETGRVERWRGSVGEA